MAALTTQLITNAGTPPTPVAAAASDTAEIGTGSDTWAEYTVGGTATTITVIAPGNNSYGQANPDPTFTSISNTTRRIPLRKEYDDGTGRATITTSQQTGVTVAIVRVG